MCVCCLQTNPLVSEQAEEIVGSEQSMVDECVSVKHSPTNGHKPLTGDQALLLSIDIMMLTLSSWGSSGTELEISACDSESHSRCYLNDFQSKKKKKKSTILSSSSLEGSSSVSLLSRWCSGLEITWDPHSFIMIQLLFQAFLSSVLDSYLLDVLISFSSNYLFAQYLQLPSCKTVIIFFPLTSEIEFHFKFYSNLVAIRFWPCSRMVCTSYPKASVFTEDERHTRTLYISGKMTEMHKHILALWSPNS